MPSLYDDFTDEELGRRIQAKHPGFQHDDPAELGRTAKARFPYNGPPRAPISPGPSAAKPTVPEKPGTLEIQLRQLKAGKRRVVMFPRRTPVPFSAKQFSAHRMDTAVGTFFFNPKLITAQAIRSAIQGDKLQDILGDKDLGYGAPAKQDLQPPVTAVVAKAPGGMPVQAVASDMENQPETVAAAQAVTPTGGSVSVESPAKALGDRLGPSDDDGKLPEGKGIPMNNGALPVKGIPDGMKWRKAKRLGLLK